MSNKCILMMRLHHESKKETKQSIGKQKQTEVLSIEMKMMDPPLLYSHL